MQEGKVCWQGEALYGLKSSPHAWFDRFRLAVMRYGYKRCHAYQNVFVKRHNDKFTMLIVYVNDIIITGNDETKKNNNKKNEGAKRLILEENLRLKI